MPCRRPSAVDATRTRSFAKARHLRIRFSCNSNPIDLLSPAITSSIIQLDRIAATTTDHPVWCHAHRLWACSFYHSLKNSGRVVVHVTNVFHQRFWNPQPSEWPCQSIVQHTVKSPSLLSDLAKGHIDESIWKGPPLPLGILDDRIKEEQIVSSSINRSERLLPRIQRYQTS